MESTKKELQEKVEGFLKDGLYRVEKDTDGTMLGLFASEFEGIPPEWHPLLIEGTDAEKALEDAGVYTPEVRAYGAAGGGV
jgi:hypothetical protein